MVEPDPRIAALFQDALGIGAAERSAWLAARCGDDAELLREVAELLALHDEDAADGDDLGELDGPATALRDLADETWLRGLPPGTRVGGHVIRRAIARGGMGTVYEAEQLAPPRRVALKVLAAHLEGGVAARHFEYEARILASLRHPGIAQVFDCGTLQCDGRNLPWFAMEFVDDARSITAWAAERELDLHGRIELVAAVCDAVHHGHRKGIVHRDLKPANLLVDAHGTPKVIDFGIAKVGDADPNLATLQTLAGQVVGTLGYMSPEQARGGGAEIDTRSDVYSLGVVLFELVTGDLPYAVEGQSLVAAARTVVEVEPDRKALAAAGVPSDVRRIVRKALRKDPEQRYDSAAALGDDLRRWLRGEPITARPPSAIYVIGRFASRNRWLVVALSACLLALVLGSVGTLIGFLRASRAQRDAQWGRDFLVAMLYDADPFGGAGPRVDLGDALTRAAARLDVAVPSPELEAEMRAIFAEVLEKIGESRNAEPHFLRAIELLAARGAEAAVRVRKLRLGLVLCWTNLGRFDDAEPLARTLVRELRAELRSDHPDRLRGENALGQLLASRGRHAEALQVLDAALDGVEPREPDAARVAASIRNNAALCLRALGRLDEAEAALVDVVAFRAAAFGERHPETFTARANLAAIRLDRGVLADACAELERALDGQRGLLGRDDPRTLTSANNLAILYRRLGRLQDAEHLQREVLETRRRVLGAAANDTLVTQVNLAVAIAAQAVREGPAGDARLAEAIAMIEDAIATRDRSEPAPTAELANALGTLGQILLRVGRAADARAPFERAVQIAATTIDDARFEGWLFRAGAAAARGATGDRAAALEELDRDIVALEARLGSEHGTVRMVREWRAAVERGR
ncbi:MAG: tetratricopeptide repeat protein [Planctomycetes bacterium]|nr:tetratricopeptide repeat protein [Planctomycetota bacterium]